MSHVTLWTSVKISFYFVMQVLQDTAGIYRFPVEMLIVYSQQTLKYIKKAPAHQPEEVSTAFKVTYN